MAKTAEGDVKIALALVVAAAASTGLGAAVVFFPFLVKMASRRVLASSLGFSAGVMTYVSFIEIFIKAEDSFLEAGFDEGKAHGLSTLCFFGGVVVMMILNFLVSVLMGGHAHRHDVPAAPPEQTEDHPKKNTTTRDDIAESDVDQAYGCPCCTKDPASQLNTFQKMASVLEHEQYANDSAAAEDEDFLEEQQPGCQDPSCQNPNCQNQNVMAKNLRGHCDNPECQDENCPNRNTHARCEDSDCENCEAESAAGEENKNQEKGQDSGEDAMESKRLVKMGLTTALAIGLHNFPEGLATFVAALNDPSVGVVLAVAIAIHNIPEGLCVALPIYYATGKRLRAFLWAVLSGASELVAALLGWAVLANSFSDLTYAILFGLVAGMMVMISIRELMPTARFYDPNDTVVTNSFIAGMFVMALSLVLFRL